MSSFALFLFLLEFLYRFLQQQSCYYARCTMIMTKNKLFSFQHHFHYTNMMRIKYRFAVTMMFTTPWSRQKINFSFQHYFHCTVVMRIKLLLIYHDKNTVVSFFLRTSSIVSKRFVHNTVVSPSGISVKS